MKISEIINLKFIMAVAIPFLLMVYVQIHNPIVLAMAFGLVVINISKPFVLLPSVFITSPSAEYFSTSGGAGLTPWLLTFFVISLYISTKPFEYRRGRKTLAFIFLFIIYNFVSCALSVTGSFEAFFILLLCFPVVFFMDLKKGVDVDFIYKTISLSCFLFSFFLIYSFLTGAMELQVGFEKDERLTFGDLNANRYGMLCAPVAAVLIFSFFYSNNIFFRLLSIFGAFLTVFVIIITGCRSVLYAVAVDILLALYFFVLKASKSKGKVLMTVFLVVVVMIGINYLSQSNMLVLDRLQFDAVLESGGSGRMSRAEYLFSNVFPNSPLFGIGLGGDNEYAISEGPCHNIILDPLIQIGIVGVLLYWLFLLPQIFRCYKGLREDKLKMFPLILFVTVFVNGMGEVIFFERHFWIIVSLCILFSKNQSQVCGLVENK